MEFRVYLGCKDDMPIAIAEIPKGRVYIGEVLTCVVGTRPAIRIVDEKGTDKLPMLYDPIILKVAPVYMEIGGPVLNGSMAHLGKTLANPVAGSTKKDSDVD